MGEPIGDEDGVWRCTFEELTDAVRRGEASAEDFAVIDGICVWTKEENDDGSIGKYIRTSMRSQIEYSVDWHFQLTKVFTFVP